MGFIVIIFSCVDGEENCYFSTLLLERRKSIEIASTVDVKITLNDTILVEAALGGSGQVSELSSGLLWQLQKSGLAHLHRVRELPPSQTDDESPPPLAIPVQQSLRSTTERRNYSCIPSKCGKTDTLSTAPRALDKIPKYMVLL